MSDDTEKDAGLREVSPEEYQAMVSSGQSRQTKQPVYRALPRMSNSAIATIAIVIVSLAVGFFFGVDYQKTRSAHAHNTTVSGMNQNRFGQYGGRGMRRGNLGQVTAVSNSSITINNQRTGSSDTYKITGSTTVSNNGSSANVSDIKTGDTVVIRTSSTDTGTASSILINPSFGGSGGMMQSSPQTNDNTNNSSNTPDSGPSAGSGASSI